MSIQMEMKIRWSIILNTTKHTWQDLQQPIAAAMKDEYIFNYTETFKRVSVLTVGENCYSLWARADRHHDIEFAVMYAEQDGGDNDK